MKELEEEDIAAIAERVADQIMPKLSRLSSPEGDSSIMDVAGLAQYLKVGKQWVYDRVHRNNIPYYKVGKYPRFRKSAIDDWLRKMERGGGQKPSKTVRRLLENSS